MFVIWLLLNEKNSKYLEKIIKNLSLEFNSPKFIPHITIYGLIDLDFKKVEKIVKESIVGIIPFDVKITRIEQSENIWKSIFIDVEKNEKLFLIKTKLNQEFIQCNKNKFLPHISLIYKKLTKKQKLEIIKNLKIKNKLKIDKICILEFSENVSEWKIVKIFKL